MAERILKAEYARLRGVSRAAVGRWGKRGFLVMVGDLVDVAATNAKLDARPAVYRGGRAKAVTHVTANLAATSDVAPDKAPPTAPDDPASWSTANAIRVKETANALLKQLEYDQKAGRLLPADEVEALWRGHITDARKRLLTVPSRCGSRIAHLSRAEVEVIDREIRDALTDLAGAP